VLALALNGDYDPNEESWVATPVIDIGHYSDVRVQYRRWLGVEDGFYDDARLVINGTEVWKNFASASEPQQNGVHHIDRVWRFADFELAAFEASGTATLRFELASDEGLQFGGWTLDDVCIVEPAAGPGDPNCGNGAVDANETCDDGNVADGDGCSAMCETEDGGGGTGPDDPAEGGCCNVGGRPSGALALSLLTLGGVFRRRRRR
jgi:cysteine-rich repeat protein